MMMLRASPIQNWTCIIPFCPKHIVNYRVLYLESVTDWEECGTFQGTRKFGKSSSTQPCRLVGDMDSFPRMVPFGDVSNKILGKIPTSPEKEKEKTSFCTSLLKQTLKFGWKKTYHTNIPAAKIPTAVLFVNMSWDPKNPNERMQPMFKKAKN